MALAINATLGVLARLRLYDGNGCWGLFEAAPVACSAGLHDPIALYSRRVQSSPRHKPNRHPSTRRVLLSVNVSLPLTVQPSSTL